MARGVEVADNTTFLEGTSLVVHVAEVVFSLDVVYMVADELVLVWELEQVGEELEQFDDDLLVAFAAKGFDLFAMVLEDGWVDALVVAVEFGQVVDLDVVSD